MKTKIKDIKDKLSNNKIVKALGFLIITYVYLALFSFPNTLINSGFFVYGSFIFLGYLVIYALKRIIKKEKITINKTRNEILKFSLDGFVLGIFINTIFFLVLSLVNPNLAYTYSFGNFEAYNNATDSAYLLITVILLPLFDNLLMRRLLDKAKTKKGKIIFSVFLSFFVFCIAATYISGLYLMIINFILNMIYINRKSLKETIALQSIIAFTLASMTLWFSAYKIAVVIIMILICCLSLYINLKQVQETK